jgi:hypothetical protein
MLAELLLSRHWDGQIQSSPLMLLVAGLVVVAAARTPPRLLGGVMVLFVLNGLAGIVLHYIGKAAFVIERNPAMAGWALMRETIFKGAQPPILAPGAMIALGLLGLIIVQRENERGTE